MNIVDIQGEADGDSYIFYLYIREEARAARDDETSYITLTSNFTNNELIDILKKREFFTLSDYTFAFVGNTVWLGYRINGGRMEYPYDADNFCKKFIDCLNKIEYV